MAELLLVNPSRRKRKASSARRRKNPLTAAERKRVVAALKSKHVTKGEKAAIRRELKAMRDAEKAAAGHKPKRRKATTKRKTKMAKKSARRSHKSTRSHKRARPARKMARRVKFTRSQARKYTRKSKRVHRAARVLGKRSAAKRIYHINPLNASSMKAMLVPALAGALGGVVITRGYDMIVAKVDAIPSFLKPAEAGGNDYGAAAAKALLAIGAGMLLEKTKVISPQHRNAAIGGALVVIVYDLLEGTVLPAMGMHGYQTVAGYQSIEGLGDFEYLDDTDDSGDYGMEGLGYINSAQAAGVLTGRQFTG